jgi:hypothetical protein
VNPREVLSADEARAYEHAVIEAIEASMHLGPFGGRMVESVELEGEPGQAQVVFRYIDRMDLSRVIEARGEIWIAGATLQVVNGAPVLNPAVDVGAWVLEAFRAWELPTREVGADSASEEPG